MKHFANPKCDCDLYPTTGQDYAGPSGVQGGVQVTCGCPTKHCEHYESDFDRFVKETDWAVCPECQFEINPTHSYHQPQCSRGNKWAEVEEIVSFHLVLWGDALKAGLLQSQIEEYRDSLKALLEAAREEGLAASSSDAQDGAYQNGLIAGRKEGMKEALGLMPMAYRAEWMNEERVFTTEYMKGWNLCRTTIIDAIEALIQARKAGGDN